MTRRLTALIEREGDGFVAICPEVDIASQGDTTEQARENLQEAVELLFETASADEIRERLHKELRKGTLLSIIRQSGVPREQFESIPNS